MRALLLPLVAFAALIIASGTATGCGSLREHAARERYLGQMLYDYVYDQPMDEVWREAMGVAGRSQSAGSEDGATRVWTGPVVVHPHAQGAMNVRVYAEAVDERRTRVAFLRAAPDGPDGRELGWRDLDGRVWELEVRLLRKLAPEDAEKIENGSLRAARRARD